MDPKEVHDMEQVSGAMLALAGQVAVFYHALVMEKVPESAATYLSGLMMVKLLLPGGGEHDG